MLTTRSSDRNRVWFTSYSSSFEKYEAQKDKSDTRVTTTMIYWFLRKKDNEYLALDSEKQASDLYYRRDFRSKFEYVGRSSGQTYLKTIKDGNLRKFTPAEYNEMAQSGVSKELEPLVAERQAVAKEALNKEREFALANPDKTPPRNFRFVGIDGQPIEDSFLVGFLKQMK